jgi:hypothetical protein
MSANNDTARFITKDQEKNMLRRLGANNTYFADSFNESDVKIMQSNIDNDFHLLLGTSYDKHCQELQAQRDEYKKVLDLRNEEHNSLTRQLDLARKANDAKFNLLQHLLTEILKADASSPIAYLNYTQGQIVRAKLKNQIELISQDYQYIDNLIEQAI